MRVVRGYKLTRREHWDFCRKIEDDARLVWVRIHTGGASRTGLRGSTLPMIERHDVPNYVSLPFNSLAAGGHPEQWVAKIELV